ncbi:MAG TPA: response regulator [Firmicutes bacterium]|nr:response regulator [Candidatus Fermentithermobacillaceae bacterium]
MDVIPVFIVEDDPMVLELHRRFVESVEGFKVVGSARDGESALREVERTKPELVILDVFMPEMDGLALLRRLREMTAPVDVIMVTAAQESTTVGEALRLGAVDYLIKPFRLERFREALERYRERQKRLQDGSLSQEDVDRLWNAGGTARGRELPKGVQAYTLSRVRKVLKDHADKSLSAEEMAELTGISRITARRYLEHLVATGLARLEPEYGSVGRPVNRYRWVG